MDWLVLWGVANVTTFAFTTVLTTLAQGALEDYVKDFFKACIHELVDLAKEKPLKVAFGQAVKEFLGLIQQELEDAELTQVEVEDYTESLTALMADKTAIELLGMPFQKALGKTADTDNQSFDVERVVQIWHRLNLKPLPDSFNWQRVAKRYGRKINYVLRESDELRQRLDSETITHLRQQLEQLTPISPDFELSRYQAGLIDAYDTLKLDTLDTRGCDYRLKLWRVFMPQNLREAENHPPGLSVLNVLNQPQLYKYSVILGNPGSGKSTLLQYKALIWARNQPSVLPLLELPLLIELRNYVENRQKLLCKNFLDYLHHGTGVLGGTLNQKDLDEWLRNRQTLVMFDGLDEIFDIQEQTNVVIDLINFTKTYPQARIVITSRILGYNQQRQRLRHAQFREFTLQDLDDEQIHSFIEQWHRLTYEDKRDGQKKRDRLLYSINTSRPFRELAGNPLLLTMMAILNRYEELPRDRPTLYKQASEVLLQRWDAEKELPDDERLDPRIIDYIEKQEMLRQVAHHIQSRVNSLSGNLTINRSDLLQILTRCLERIGFAEPGIVARLLMEKLTTRSFILCFKGGKAYGFVHRTFLEYFCAWYFVEQFEVKQTITLADIQQQIFAPHWQNPTWHEVLSLIVGMISERFAKEMIEYLMKQDSQAHEYRNLFLAVQCLADVRNIGVLQSTILELANQLNRVADGTVNASDAVRNHAREAISILHSL